MLLIDEAGMADDPAMLKLLAAAAADVAGRQDCLVPVVRTNCASW